MCCATQGIANSGLCDRMVKDHAKRQDLNAPDWLKQEWRTGNKNAIAATLQEVNFDKATCSH